MDQHRRALDLAFRALNARERTEHELRELLERRAVEREVIEDVVRSLAGEGLVDDEGYARRFADDRRLLDRWGTERIARDLARRGVGDDAIDGALGQVDRADE